MPVDETVWSEDFVVMKMMMIIMWVMINIIIIIFITIKSLLVQPVGMLHQSHYRATAKEEQRSTKSQITDNHPHHPHHTNHQGVHPNSHKHFFPYMGFCASIWGNVRHHCHHHHHHHHIQKSKSINTEACLIAH